MPSHVDFGVFDADNHYYEAEDAFIRHVPRDMRKRCMQWAEIGGRKRLLVAGRVNRFIPNPTWDPVARPGALDDYFRGRNTEGQDVKTMFGELDPLDEHPEYQDPDARLSVMDDQGIDAALFFPTLGVGMQQSLSHDPEALTTAFGAFNRWLEEDWGFAHADRIFAAPMITFIDPEAAAREVRWAVDHGARMVCMVPGPVPTDDGGSLSPGNEIYDPVWKAIADAGIAVGIHGGDGGLADYIDKWEPMREMEAFRSTPFRQVISHNRQIFDTFAALICHGVFSRFPSLRIASIENGAGFVPQLLEDLGIAYGKTPQEFAEDPVETFRRHVWVSPYYEDDLEGLKDLIGADHLLFGSDYPHAEGLAEPTAFIDDISGFSDEETRLVMRDNGFRLIGEAA